ncbi:hypothetical protein [Phycicoccus endophyticus]|uniref:hypothetical protein n=1 Tax=Phycicoccus endophyticus TaxID=1690220 RepID=UPI0030B84A53
MRVLEARQEHPPREVDPLGPGPGEVEHLVVAHRDDPAAVDGHRRRAGTDPP